MPKTLAEAYDVLLFDLDGVVYIGGTAIPGAPEALQNARKAGDCIHESRKRDYCGIGAPGRRVNSRRTAWP